MMASLRDRALLQLLLLAFSLNLLRVQGAPLFRDGYEATTVVRLKEFATDICFLPGVDGKDRFLVALKSGVVLTVVGQEILPEPFMDISDRTNTAQDRGMSACVADNNFAASREVFFFYTYEDDPSDPSGPKTSKVARVTADESGNRADMNTFTTIVGFGTPEECDPDSPPRNVLCANSIVHANGALAMDDQGNLIISNGDGNLNNPTDLSERAQSLDNWSGKVLRVTRDGKAVQGNYFYKDGMRDDDPMALIYALGFRSSWRLYFDKLIGLPVGAELGWSRTEEINVLPPGANCGWPCVEGFDRNSAYDEYKLCQRYHADKEEGFKHDPVFTYDHDVGAGITAILRLDSGNANWASQDLGWIYYCDYVFGWMKRIRVDASGQVVDAGPEDFARNLDGPIALKTAPTSKNVYYLALTSKEVRLVSYKPDTTPPKVELINPPDGFTGAETTTRVTVTFSKHMDPDTLQRPNFVVRVLGLDAVPGEVSYDRSTKTASFRPSERFSKDTEYAVAVQNVADPAGRVMQGLFRSTFKTGQGFSVRVSSLDFVEEVNGLGPPERNQNMNGGPLSIRGEVFDTGLGTAPEARVSVEVPSECFEVEGVVGIDDAVANLEAPPAVASVFVNGETQYESDISRADEGARFRVDVSPSDVVTFAADFGKPVTPKQSGQRLTSWGDLIFRCGPVGGGDQGDAPTVSSVTPSDGAENVGVRPVIAILFSKPMDRSTLLAAVEVSDSLEAAVAYEADFNDASTTMELKFSSDLERSSGYTVKVSTSAKDVSGRSLANFFRSVFTTAGLPPSGLRVSMNRLRQVDVQGNPRLRTTDLEVLRFDAPTITRTYLGGLVMRAPNVVRYNIGAGCTEFQATIGIEGRVDATRADALLQVFLGPTMAFSAALTASDFARRIVLPVNGTMQLEVRTQFRGPLFDGEYVVLGNPVAICANRTVHLQGLAPMFVANPGGLYRNVQQEGRNITLRGAPPATDYIEFLSGFAQHATSSVTYQLPDNCGTMSASVGVDLLSQFYGNMKFAVSTDDGKTVCESPVLGGGAGLRRLECDIKGSSTVTLTTNSVGPVSAHNMGIWGAATLDCATDALKPKCIIDPLPGSFKVGDTIPFSGVGQTFSGAKLPAAQLSWDVLLVHCDPSCHIHEFQTLDGEELGQFVVPDHGSSYYFEVQCTACTLQNDCRTTVAAVDAEEAVVTVETDPPGLTVGVDSLTGEAPLSKSAVVNAAVQITAVESQNGLTFVRWSHDDSAPSSTLVVLKDKQPMTFTAVFA